MPRPPNSGPCDQCGQQRHSRHQMTSQMLCANCLEDAYRQRVLEAREKGTQPRSSQNKSRWIQRELDFMRAHPDYFAPEDMTDAIMEQRWLDHASGDTFVNEGAL